MIDTIRRDPRIRHLEAVLYPPKKGGVLICSLAPSKKLLLFGKLNDLKSNRSRRSLYQQLEDRRIDNENPPYAFPTARRNGGRRYAPCDGATVRHYAWLNGLVPTAHDEQESKKQRRKPSASDLEAITAIKEMIRSATVENGRLKKVAKRLRVSPRTLTRNEVSVVDVDSGEYLMLKKYIRSVRYNDLWRPGEEPVDLKAFLLGHPGFLDSSPNDIDEGLERLGARGLVVLTPGGKWIPVTYAYSHRNRIRRHIKLCMMTESSCLESCLGPEGFRDQYDLIVKDIHDRNVQCQLALDEMLRNKETEAFADALCDFMMLAVQVQIASAGNDGHSRECLAQAMSAPVRIWHDLVGLTAAIHSKTGEKRKALYGLHDDAVKIHKRNQSWEVLLKDSPDLPALTAVVNDREEDYMKMADRVHALEKSFQLPPG